MKHKYTLAQNLGTDDARHCNSAGECALPLEPKKLQAGQSVELTDKAHEWLTKTKGYKNLFEQPEETTTPEPTPAPEESPVHQSNVAEAIATIENMRSKDKLQHVIDNDPRPTVKEAAKKRLAAL